MTHLRCLTKSEALEIRLEDAGELSTDGVTFNSRDLIRTIQRKFAFLLWSRHVSIEIRVQREVLLKMLYKMKAASKTGKLPGLRSHESLL